MPQRWIDNWRTTTAVALGSFDVVPLDELVTGDPLTRLQDLLGGSAANWIELTLDSGDGFTEVLKVDGAGALVRDWTETGVESWPAGSIISARLTAKAVEALAAPSGLTRANLIAKLEAGHAGQADGLFWADADLGAYARHDFGRCFSWADIDTDFSVTESPGFWDVRDGYARAIGSGAGTRLFRSTDVNSLHTGTTAAGTCEVAVGPAPAGIYAPQPAFSLASDPIAEIDVRLVLRLVPAATAAEDFNLEWALSVPGLGLIRFLQQRAVNSGNLTIVYKNASNVDTTLNTSRKLDGFDRAFGVNVVPAGADHTVVISYRPNGIASDTGKEVLAALNASGMASATVQFGYTAKITKIAGTTSRGLQVKRFAAKLTLTP
jgi:hypothetical protein